MRRPSSPARVRRCRLDLPPELESGPFHHGAQQMAGGVAERQAEEDASRVWIAAAASFAPSVCGSGAVSPEEVSPPLGSSGNAICLLAVYRLFGGCPTRFVRSGRATWFRMSVCGRRGGQQGAVGMPGFHVPVRNRTGRRFDLKRSR